MDTEKTRQTLRRRADIPNEDIDDIIERAEMLQNAENEHSSSHATLEEVEAVAEELDIAPNYVEDAIQAMRAERDTQSQGEARRTTLRRRWLKRTGLVAAVFSALSMIGGVGVGMTGASALSNQAQVVAQHEMALSAAYNRQATLAPQFTALAGADNAAVLLAAQALREASDPAAKRVASTNLGAEMSVAIGQIPRLEEGSTSQRLLNLQYEIVGSSNRIEAETGRYDAATAEWNRLAQSMSGRLALSLGLAETPIGLH